MAKRTLEETEFEDVSSVDDPSPNAKIHGVLTTLSPVKKSLTCNYFHGELKDGKLNMRLFGFDSVEVVIRKLYDLQGKDTTGTLSNREIKRSRKGQQLETFLGKECQVEMSAEAFDVSSIAPMKYGKAISLSLTYMYIAQMQRVSVDVKTLRVDDSIQVTGGKRKQDIIVRGNCQTNTLGKRIKEDNS